MMVLGSEDRTPPYSLLWFWFQTLHTVPCYQLSVSVTDVLKVMDTLIIPYILINNFSKGWWWHFGVYSACLFLKSIFHFYFKSGGYISGIDYNSYLFWPQVRHRESHSPHITCTGHTGQEDDSPWQLTAALLRSPEKTQSLAPMSLALASLLPEPRWTSLLPLPYLVLTSSHF